MTLEWERIDRLVQQARARGADVLLETEGLEMLAALGIGTPPHVFVAKGAELPAADLDRLTGERVVVKVISPTILHKSDVGGVKIVARDLAAVRETIAAMEHAFERHPVAGYTINQFIAYDAALGNELLLGLRWTDDFGPVVTLGPGGIYTEFLAANFRPGRDVAILSPDLGDEQRVAEAIEAIAVADLLTGRMRGQAPRIATAAILPAVRAFMMLAARMVPESIAECEINPLVVSRGELVALDILVKLGTRARGTARLPRPVAKLKRLLEPASAALIGVSDKLNPGHIILNNLIREGFDRSQISVVKPGADSIEGCRCVPDIGSIPGTVDLFVLSISAAQAPEAIAEIIERRKAETLIVIPGGLEEKQGSEKLVARMREALDASRATPWQGPLINGGNCLGIRSRPGRYDTMFIPEHKLPVPVGRPSPVAILSQSGAFAITQMSKLARLNPKYAISVGNQMDLTIGDYLDYLKHDPEIAIFSIYVEGFTELDGKRFLEATRDIVASGRHVIVYRAGRTAAGAQASRSHTAAIAGDYAVTRALATAAGAIVADTLGDFADLTRLFAALGRKPAAGWGLGAVSNAGFECVAIADNLGRFHLPPFAAPTADRLQAIFRETRIDSVVDVHNPIDLTPMAGDAAYEDVVRAVFEDPGVHAGIVGCVPLTPALNTLAAGPEHRDDVSRHDGIAARLARLADEIAKPWVAVVDAGALYDPFVGSLERGGVPTFREADRALRLLNIFVRETNRRRAAV
jgi:acyl-CoA synthetase (NDP forming)